jgi:hypothetical protein
VRNLLIFQNPMTYISLMFDLESFQLTPCITGTIESLQLTPCITGPISCLKIFTLGTYSQTSSWSWSTNEWEKNFRNLSSKMQKHKFFSVTYYNVELLCELCAVARLLKKFRHISVEYSRLMTFNEPDLWSTHVSWFNCRLFLQLML